MSEKMNKGKYREMGHTAYLFASMVEGHLVESYTDAALRKKATRAMEILYDIYAEAIGKG